MNALGKALYIPNVTAVKVHTTPRRRLFQHQSGKKRSRVTLAIEESAPNKVRVIAETPEQIAVGQESAGEA